MKLYETQIVNFGIIIYCSPFGYVSSDFGKSKFVIQIQQEVSKKETEIIMNSFSFHFVLLYLIPSYFHNVMSFREVFNTYIDFELNRFFGILFD